MSAPTGQDPIDRLHAADPVHAETVPDASLARVTARIQEHIMSDKPLDPKTTRRPIRGSLVLVGGLAVVGVLALAVAFGSGFGGQTPPPVAVNPTPTETPAPSGDPAAGGGGVASCLVYDPANLPTFDVVFDGTVTAVEGDQATFTVNEGWKGATGTITLTVPETNVAITGPMPAFEVGGRYLVSASGNTINACGYSVDYDAETAAAWAAAFPG